MKVDAIRRVALEVAYGLRVCLPGQIETYDFKTQRASVLPLIADTLADGETLAYPVIDAVPVVWPRGSGCSLTMPLRRGDGVQLQFADRALERWLSRPMGEQVAAGDERVHDLTDCIAVPGLYPLTSASNAENNDDVLLMLGEDKVRLKPNGIELQRGGSRIVMTDKGVRIEGDELEFVARKVRKDDLNGYGETRFANGGASYTFNTWTQNAVINGVSAPIAPPEHEANRIKI